ncbi:MAG: hypothetical protein ACE5GB_13950, partial [Acidimicrobiales bacterium]
FFIQWDGDDHPGRLPAPHRLQPDGITGVAVGPVGPNIAQVLAPVPSVTVSGTEPGVKSVVIAAAEGEIRLG